MQNLVIELHYFPGVNYLAALTQSDRVLIEAHENYVKQTCRNRCYILGANKVNRLSIPVSLSSEKDKTAIREVRIDHNQKWENIHWRSIISAYGKAPYFEYYVDEIYRAFFKKQAFLYDWNYHLLTLCLKLLRINIQIDSTETYQHQYSENVIDLRSSNYLENFSSSADHVYTQVFGKDFVKNLSVLDLLFCEGPNAYQYLVKVGQSLMTSLLLPQDSFPGQKITSNTIISD